jgi:hypothetical protein
MEEDYREQAVSSTPDRDDSAMSLRNMAEG